MEKFPPNENAGDFAMQNIRNTGWQSTCGTSLSECYHGIMITNIASGLYS